MKYFSEVEEGMRPRNIEEIDERTWGGIRALVTTNISNGSFGAKYPRVCEDGKGPTGCDETLFLEALQAEVPQITNRFFHEPAGMNASPRTVDILDMIQFCWSCVGQPEQRSYHDFYDHHHLQFDIDAGQVNFCNDVNRIFRRNGMIYELTTEGEIKRLASKVLRNKILSEDFRTGDDELDDILETAQQKFLSPDETIRLEALEKLWDAWERLKTILNESSKKSQVRQLLDIAAGDYSPLFRDMLEKEASQLTDIGNQFQIRHSETNQEKLVVGSHAEYLFHRLFALIQLILRKLDSGI